MKRLRVPPKTLFVLLIVITILCSPSADIYIYRFQFAALPESWHALAIALRSVPPNTLVIWLSVALLSPIVTGTMFVAKFFDWRLKSRDKTHFAAVTLWIISWSTLFLGTDHANARYSGLTRVTERGKPIIVAIEKYHADNGKYPAKLEVLVPAYLAEIPYTGIIGYPKFEYELSDTNSDEEYKDDSSGKYELFVSMAYMKPFDEQSDYFMYWPEKKYPESVNDRFALYPINGWAYAEYIS